MKKTLLVQFIAIGSFVAAAAPSDAQEITAKSFDQMRMLVKLGDTVTVTETAGDMTTGRLAELTPSSLGLLVHDQQRNLRETDVVVITRHTHANLATGARWGFGVGAVLGLVGGLAVSSECRSCAGFVPVMTAIYGGMGAGIGVGIAAMTPARPVIFRLSR
jgi:hypothetical protein